MDTPSPTDSYELEFQDPAPSATAPERRPTPPEPDGSPRDETREPPRSLGKALGQIGAGLILAGSIVGTGELIATTGLGATHGYSLLWFILLSCVIKVFVQVELGRYAITHGRTTLAAFDTLPAPAWAPRGWAGSGWP